MNISPLARLARLLAAVSFLFVCGITEMWALGGGAAVTYDPASQGVSITLPSNYTYVLNVTSPAGISGYPITVNLRKVATYYPLGDAATALSYVQFSTNTLTFTAPGQKLPVTVTADFPVTALSLDVPAGAYTYQIYTDGWPAGVVDNGAQINSSVSLPVPSTGNPPTVSIDTPVDGTTFNYAVSALPAQISFQFSASVDANSNAITSVDAMFGTATAMAPIPVSTSALPGRSITGGGSFTVSAPGTYMLQVSATNDAGTATDTSTYIVTVSAPPPTVTINTPTPNSSYTYRLGEVPASVPFDFTAHSNYGGIRTLVAYVDGVETTFTATGIGTLDASGLINLLYTAAGTHIVSVTTTDDYGNVTANSNFTINVVAPTPTLTITAPSNNAVFTIPASQTSMDVSYAFTTTSNNGFVVDSVAATLGSTALNPATTGLHTATAQSTGTMVGLAPGSYTLTATGTSAGIPVQQSVTFTVKSSVLPPTVVINSPAPNATFTRYLNGPALSIPLTFAGTSNNPNGVITNVTATLDGSPLTVTATLNQKVVPATATMSVTAAGTHTIVVTATDAVGTATATQAFSVTVLQGSTISGTVFFDLNTDGNFTGTEFGLAGIAVQLKSSNQVIGAKTTANDGSYSFDKLAPGTYTITATAYAGLIPTRGTTRTVTVAATDVNNVNIGFMLDFCALQGMAANGYTIGYWKNNLSKAIAGKSGGTQVSAAKLTAYTVAIGSLALSPYDNISMKGAVAVMSSTSDRPTDLLSKQLIASEYNYENAAYLNGNAPLTYFFISWGEYVLGHPSQYSSAYILWAKDWFDAYNNTHGGAISGPALLGISCTGSTTCGG